MVNKQIISEIFGVQIIRCFGCSLYTDKPIFDLEHASLRAVEFKAETDVHDNLVSESLDYVFRGKLKETQGHVFIFDSAVLGKSLVYIVPAPDCIIPVLSINEYTVKIKTQGVDVITFVSDTLSVEKILRAVYKLSYKPKELVAMSNTWGDRSGRTKICDAFIREEIDSAAELGIDVVQIDDGWQKDIPDVYDENGVRFFDDNFWELKKAVFPNGIRSLSDYAKARGVRLGLWFAPHSRNVFEKFDRDIAVIKNAYLNWHVTHFKLDMLSLPDMEYVNKMQELLDNVSSFGDDIGIQLDVTYDKRLGYLAGAEYGTIFVENRYTAWSNYYPHRTLRNLWRLSRYIPTSKFQFEIVNPTLNRDKYSSEDMLRPELYDVDYMFACVMFANPLFWMETQFLPQDCRRNLKPLIKEWRSHREFILEADVYPVAEEPNGAAITGFVAQSNEIREIILIRECCERNTYTLKLDKAIQSAELIFSNTEIEISACGSDMTVKFGKMRSYAWIKVKTL